MPILFLCWKIGLLLGRLLRSWVLGSLLFLKYTLNSLPPLRRTVEIVLLSSLPMIATISLVLSPLAGLILPLNFNNNSYSIPIYQSLLKQFKMPSKMKRWCSVLRSKSPSYQPSIRRLIWNLPRSMNIDREGLEEGDIYR